MLDETGTVLAEAISIKIGSFLQSVIDFTIIAFVIFILIRLINKLKNKKEEVIGPPANPEPSNEEKLLMEIRDAIKSKT